MIFYCRMAACRLFNGPAGFIRSPRNSGGIPMMFWGIPREFRMTPYNPKRTPNNPKHLPNNHRISTKQPPKQPQ